MRKVEVRERRRIKVRHGGVLLADDSFKYLGSCIAIENDVIQRVREIQRKDH